MDSGARTIDGEWPTRPRRSRRWEWLLLAILLTATMLNYADRQALPVVAVRVKAELQLSNEQYGTVAGYFGIAFACGALLSGILADWISVRWLYPAVLLIWSVAGIVTGRAESFVGLLVSRLVLGLFESAHWPCALRTTQRVFPPARRTLGNSVLQSGAPLGAILASVMALTLVSAEVAGSWRQIFWYTGLLGLPWVLIWLFSVRADDLRRPVLQTRDTADGGAAPIQEVPFLHLLRTRRYWLLILLVVCINTCWHYIRVWMPLALEENLGYRFDQIQVFFIVYWLATFAGSLTCGWLTSHLARRGWGVHRARMSVFFACSLLTALSVVAAFLPPSWFFLVLMLLVGFGSLGQFPIYYSLTQELSAKNQGKVTGSLGFTTWAVLYFVHPRVGWLMDHYPDARPYIFATVGLLPLLGGWAVASLWTDRPARRA